MADARNLALEARVARNNFQVFCRTVHGVELALHMLLWVELYTSDDPDEREIAISAPPEYWKSRVVRMYIEWSMGRKPEWARLLVMNTSEQAEKQVMSVRDTIDNNPRYHAVFPHVEKDPDRPWNRTTLFTKRENSARPDASLFGTGVLGPIQGGHYEEIFLDDVSDQHDVRSTSTMTQQREWVRGVLIDRLMRDDNDVPVGRIVAILTRWSADDLWITYTSNDPDDGMGMTGHMTPAYNYNEPYKWGPLLWPEEYPQEKLDGILRRKGQRLFTLTFLCDPAAAGGLKFKINKLMRFDLNNPPPFSFILHSWDTAGGLSDDASNSVCEEWGIGPLGFYLTWVWAEKRKYSEVKSQMIVVNTERPSNRTLLEYKHSGQLLYDEFEDDTVGIRGIEAIHPKGDKITRASAIEPYLDAGMLWVPQDGQTPWLAPFLQEFGSFPASRYMDRIDAMSQGVIYMRKIRGKGSGAPAGSYMNPPQQAQEYDDEDEFMKVPPPPFHESRSYMG